MLGLHVLVWLGSGRPCDAQSFFYPDRVESAATADSVAEPAVSPAVAADSTFPVPPCACDASGQAASGTILGVDGCSHCSGREALWRDERLIPWESFAYGEYVGPSRTPHVDEYRLRVNDQLEFVYMLDRMIGGAPYELSAGDVVQINSATDPDLNQTNLTVLSDGTISLRLVGRVRAAGLTVDAFQQLLDEKYVEKGVRAPEIVVQVLQSDTPLRDLRDAVDARAGSGGQSRLATVAPDGTVQLPLIQSVPAVGLSLDELAREVNARYRERIRGIEVSPILVQRAPRVVYVLGEVNRPGQVTLSDPTTVIQAISQAGGWRQGANLNSVIIFRRDENWRLVAARLNLRGALSGQRPIPCDEIWLRDSDIVLVPKMSIQRLSELVDLYFTRTIYSVFRFQGIDFQFDNSSVIVQ
jgi:polysaccharide export outer membrane protein